MQTELDKIIELDVRDKAASIAQDFQTLLSLWTNDGVALPLGEDPIVGKDAINLWLQGEDEADYQVTKYIHNFEERKILGDWAFEWGTFFTVAEHKAGGEPIEASGKLLRILQRQPDGTWKVARARWNIDPSIVNGG